MKPLFKTGYFTKTPVARLLKGLTISRHGVCLAIGEYAFGLTWR